MSAPSDTPDIPATLELLRKRANRLAHFTAKRLEDDQRAACYLHGQFMIPATTPLHFDEFDHARAEMLEMIARRNVDTDASAMTAIARGR